MLIDTELAQERKKLDTPPCLVRVHPQQGILRANEAVELTLTVTPLTRGRHKFEIPCVVGQGAKLFLAVDATGCGPVVRFSDDVVDFELLNFGNAGCFKDVPVVLVNESDARANVVLTQGHYRPAPFLPSKLYPISHSRPVISFSPQRAIIPPKQTLVVTARFKPHRVSRLRSHIECHVLDGEIQYVGKPLGQPLCV